MANIGSERSMEEILSSIKRVISEGSDVRLRRGETRGNPDILPEPDEDEPDADPDVLELTEPDPMPEASDGGFHQTFAAAIEPEPEDARWQAIADEPVVEAPEPVPAPAPVASAAPAPSAAPLPSAVDGEAELVSSQAAAASRQSLASLSRLVVKEAGGDVTLEALVRDMLRPMLAEWLDKNLPATVERLVQAEIRRIAAQDAP
ncbi:hypothetical protein GGR88_000223 [Sphingomonas jejuensis]|uniref:DUF2497 domain-containing protein n=1 Tax=Sphingomonas jejuensis TaxID=904715 RepID=A0ABX0XHQ5_9SPHN|nr:DUF2497 domain-containing protein [Sphingomonas jejuensis]NJC32749.1 hypothetical protein [Sphingomonas jejuensis]